MRLQSPSDDPIASMRVLGMEQQRADLTQYGKNSDILQSRLSLGEQALGDVSSLLQSVRDSAIQANSGAMDSNAAPLDRDGDPRPRAGTARHRQPQGTAMANTCSQVSRTQTQPFSKTAAGVAYNGDQGVRSLQIGPNQQVADGFSGTDVFLRIPRGQWHIHHGDGRAQWLGFHRQRPGGECRRVGARQLHREFPPRRAPGEVRNSSAALVASGNYTSGSSIAFNGVEVKVSGDRLRATPSPSRRSTSKDIFSALEDLANSLDSADDTASGKSLASTAVANGLTQIDQTLDNVLNTRAVVGIASTPSTTPGRRASSWTTSWPPRWAQLRDVDYADAI